MKIRIDPEFQNKIPPLTDEEFKQLEENILEDGEVREPLVIWESEGIIVDGHNRWKIIVAHPEIHYKVKEMYFKDKWEAFDWMYKNQLGRRNLTDEQITDLRGRLYKARKHTVGNTSENRDKLGRFQLAQNAPDGKFDSTAEALAHELGINHATVKRAEQFADGIDVIREKDPEVANKILSGKTNATKKEVREIRNAEPEEIKQFIEDIKNNEPRQRKAFEEKEELKQIKAAAEEMRKPIIRTLTINDFIRDLKNNSIPFIRLLNQIVNEYSNIISGNEDTVISAIEENIENEIIKLKEKIKQ